MEKEVYMNKPQGFIMPGNENKVNMTNEFLSSRFSMKDMGEAHVILVSTLMDISEKLMPNNGQAVSLLEYSRVIGCLMYAMTCTRPDIASAGVNRAAILVIRILSTGKQFRGWINNTKDNLSTSGWVFLLAAGKKAEWLRNVILEISLWSKPIVPISIRCDSVATLTKAYSQMYNGKSRHLGIRHNIIRELITNGVVSIEFKFEFDKVYTDLEVAFVISEEQKIFDALSRSVELLQGNTALISQYYYGCLFHELLSFRLPDRRPPAEISTQKKKTGVVAPKRFVHRVKKENEPFRDYMHQMACTNVFEAVLICSRSCAYTFPKLCIYVIEVVHICQMLYLANTYMIFKSSQSKVETVVVCASKGGGDMGTNGC
nr:hypothetical protein [Tanacetum cinerariifolium]